ncbi:MAG: hypothetical protein NVS2B5_04240 [Beijerinckiaceae bacterium]
MSQDIEQRIRERAYQIWAMGGHVHGREKDHWCAAEREILATMPAATTAKAKKAVSGKMPAGAIATSRQPRRSKASTLHLS